MQKRKKTKKKTDIYNFLTGTNTKDKFKSGSILRQKIFLVIKKFN